MSGDSINDFIAAFDGVHDREAIARWTWPIAWAGHVDPDHKAACEAFRSRLRADALAALEADPDAVAVEVAGGDVARVVFIHGADTEAELVDDDQPDDRQRFAELDLVIVRTLMSRARPRHEAARIHGTRPVCCASGDGPCRPRYLVPRAHALEVVAADPDWTEILRDADEADLDVYDVCQEVPR